MRRPRPATKAAEVECLMLVVRCITGCISVGGYGGKLIVAATAEKNACKILTELKDLLAFICGLINRWANTS